MKKLATLIIASALLLFSVGLKAQTFNYTYDENGNRLSVTIVYLSQSQSSPASTVEEDLKVDEQTNLIIKIFPNPTKGELRVELSGATPEQFNMTNNSIKVWDMQGKLLYSISSVGQSNIVDLSTYNNGTYILQLFFGGKAKGYKIIKN